MTRHIFKIIWNERRGNAWLLLEYTVVFCILWFCCDYGFSLYRSYYAENGINVRHTYRIQLSKRADLPGNRPVRHAADLKGTHRTLSRHRNRRIRKPESSLRRQLRAEWIRSQFRYGRRTKNMQYAGSACNIRLFSTFSGSTCNRESLFDGTDPKAAVISPFDAKGRLFGSYTEFHEPISEIHTVLPSWGDSSFALHVTGITKPVRIIRYGSNPMSLVFHPLTPERADPTQDIMVRIRPEAETDFAERFTRDMREQFTIGPTSCCRSPRSKTRKSERRKYVLPHERRIRHHRISGNQRIPRTAGRLLVPVQARRSEIGLRVAMGSSKRKVRRMIVSETLLLLGMACVIGTAVCLNLSKTDLVEAIGIPIANRAAWGIGAEQDAINFAATSVFLAIVSVFAVWYPARQASEVPPADVLREE